MRGSLRSGVAFLLVAAGVGLCGYAALHWPRFSEEDLQASAELNLQMDLARRQLPAPPAEELERMRTQVRAEVEQEVQRKLGPERERLRSLGVVGVVLLALGVVQLVLGRTISIARAQRDG